MRDTPGYQLEVVSEGPASNSPETSHPQRSCRVDVADVRSRGTGRGNRRMRVVDNRSHACGYSYRGGMRQRRGRSAGVLAGALLVLVLASGCTPTPVPTPTPTGFASEEEAFRAAEETYRAYVDALNQVDLADPATFEPVFAWTAGDLNASDRSGLSEYHANKVTVSGESVVVRIEPIAPMTTDETVVIATCLDVSAVDVRDANGLSVVDADRIPIQSLRVTLVEDRSSPTHLLVTQIEGREGDPKCE